MTFNQFAESIVKDPAYRETLRTRAYAGTLPEAIEMFLLEAADGRVPMAISPTRAALPAQPPATRTIDRASCVAAFSPPPRAQRSAAPKSP